MWLGEFDVSAVLDFKFTTRGTTGAPTTLAGTPAVSVYKNNSTTESTSGVTLTADFDSRTGLNHVRIDTSSDGTFYATGNDFQVVITTGTVGGTSVVGETVAHFSLRNRAGLKPATAGRTLVVDAAGLADANTVKVGPTGSGTAQTARDIGLSVLISSGTGTGQLNVTSGVIQADAAKWGTVNVTGMPMPTYTQPTGFLAATFPATVASTSNITGGTITTVTNLTNAPTAGDFTATMKTSLNAATPAVTVSDKTGFKLASDGLALVTAWTVNITGTISGTVGGMTASGWAGAFLTNTTKVYADAIAGSVVKEIASNATGGGSVPTVAQIAAAMFTVNTGDTFAGSATHSVVREIVSNVAGVVGPGSTEFTVTINDDMAAPLDGAEVWVSTDSVGSNVIAGTLNTNAMGQATFLLNAGDYYLWVSHSGYNRDNPTAFTVS